MAQAALAVVDVSSPANEAAAEGAGAPNAFLAVEKQL
jgi:hypothetical protein